MKRLEVYVVATVHMFIDRKSEFEQTMNFSIQKKNEFKYRSVHESMNKFSQLPHTLVKIAHNIS